MSSRRPVTAAQPPPMAPPPQAQAPNSRQNEYFIPRDGIDREVITSDICRYLGNDALVRPGTYEDPETRHSISGYFITAYRNLTTAMIDDLKADSARWEQERRAKSSRNASGGINAPRESLNSPYSRQSNSPAVQYHHSDTYARRQQGGPSEQNAYGNARDYDPSQRSPHPGPDGPGYGYPPQPPGGQYMPPNPQAGYPSGNPGAYPPGGYSGGQPKPFSQPDPGFSPSGQQGMPYQQGQDNWVHGAARPMASGFREPSQYPPNNMGSRDQMMTTPPSQGSYAPPQHPQSGYASAGGDYYNAPPGAGYQSMPQDVHYGRGGQYQERTTSPPTTKPPGGFATSAAAPAPQTEAYAPMPGQQPTGAMPRRQEAPKHATYKPAGHR